MLWKRELDKDNASVFTNLCKSPTSNNDKIQYMFNTLILGLKEFEINREKSKDKCKKVLQQFSRGKSGKTEEELLNEFISCMKRDESEKKQSFVYLFRAIRFFNMRMYDKCLIDMESVQQNYLSRSYKKTLENLERYFAKICFESSRYCDCNRSHKDESYEPILDFEANELFPSMANVLTIDMNSEYGRHIVATDDIDVGKTVMVERCYFGDVTQKRYSTCNICLRGYVNLKPCTKCSAVMFCMDCEKNDIHRIECDIIKYYKINNENITNMRLVIRSIILAKNAFPNVDELITVVDEMLKNRTMEVPEKLTDAQSKYRAFFKLDPNVSDQTNVEFIFMTYQTIIVHPEMTAYFATAAQHRFLMHLIGHHLNIILSRELDTETCGYYKHPSHKINFTASYLNHSCTPNVLLTENNGYTVAITARPIKKNEQLFISYVKLGSSKAKRWRDLAELNFNDFKCKCVSCETDTEPPSSNEMISDQCYGFLYHTFKVEDLVNNTYTADQREFMRVVCCHFLQKFGRECWTKEIRGVITVYYCLIHMPFTPDDKKYDW